MAGAKAPANRDCIKGRMKRKPLLIIIIMASVLVCGLILSTVIKGLRQDSSSQSPSKHNDVPVIEEQDMTGPATETEGSGEDTGNTDSEDSNDFLPDPDISSTSDNNESSGDKPDQSLDKQDDKAQNSGDKEQKIENKAQKTENITDDAGNKSELEEAPAVDQDDSVVVLENGDIQLPEVP